MLTETPKNEWKVLDHGYVSLVQSWGGDESIIEAARMSTNKGFQGWGPRCNSCRQEQHQPHNFCGAQEGVTAGDEKLLKYLWEHKHHTPFEMAGMTIEVQAPIFVFREWHRHRTQSFNEMSARYTPLPAIDYVPTVERLMINAGGTNKQAGTIVGSEQLNKENADQFVRELRGHYAALQDAYEYALSVGVPKELARLMLPVGRYSRMRASANLRNWLGFLTLRMDAAAQWEIRQYAEAVGKLVAEAFPRTWALFEEGRR